ncbi:MAG TPA: hypothetical protein VK459_22155 [Polyangiaceae bacterium]|jgi:hypothetical protein|nr:hypothetical protein [Polyangiaceae bacterium]
MHIQKISWVIAVVLAGCGPSQPPPTSPPTVGPATGAPERKAVTQGECEAQGGSVVGDIGDGATHRPDYVCPSGRPPLGDIAPPTGGPMPIEGAVCCPR